MKKVTFFILLISSYYTTMMHAEKSITIKNEYRKPIILNIDNRDMSRPLGTGDYFTLSDPSNNQSLKIKVQGSPMYHSGIQKFFNQLKNSDANECTLIIKDTNNISRFEYGVTCQKSNAISLTSQFKSQPSKTNFVHLINAIHKGLALSPYYYKLAVEIITNSSDKQHFMNNLFESFKRASNDSSLLNFTRMIKIALGRSIFDIRFLYSRNAISLTIVGKDKSEISTILNNLIAAIQTDTNYQF